MSGHAPEPAAELALCHAGLGDATASGFPINAPLVEWLERFAKRDARGLIALGAVDGGSGERTSAEVPTLHSSDVESSCTRAESLGPMYVRPRSRAFACGQAMVRQVLPGEAREEVQVGARPGNSIHLVVDAGRGARK
jgi:hypothetical protein